MRSQISDTATLPSVIATMNGHFEETHEVKEYVYKKLESHDNKHQLSHDFRLEIRNNIKWILRIGVVLVILAAPNAVEIARLFFPK